MGRFQAVIFDMDGVLVDSEPLHLEALNEVLAAEGHRLTEAEYLAYVGVADEWADLIRRKGLRHAPEHYRERYHQAVLRALRRPLRPQPGVAALLDGVRARGLKVGLASSSRREWVAATLAALGFADRFDAVVSGEMVSRGKPAPDIFLLAAERLGVPPERCLVVEDAPAGVAAAKAAGMTVVAVRTPYTAGARLDAADLVLESLAGVGLEQMEAALAAPSPGREGGAGHRGT